MSSASGTSQSSSGSSSSTVEVGQDTPLSDSCSYYDIEDSTGCRKPRTCYDCLNTDVASESEGCLLTHYGFCQTMNQYDIHTDYRRTLTDKELVASGWYNFFPSINSTYCQPSDAACERCQKLVKNGGNVSGFTSSSSSGNGTTYNITEEAYREFCVGIDGCVCVEACESSDWSGTLPQDCDTTAVTPTPANTTTTVSYNSYLPLFVCLQMGVLGLFLYRRILFVRSSQRRQRTEADGPYNNVNAITSPSNRLQLTGWKAMQDEMIKREKGQQYLTLTSPHQMAPVLEDQGEISPNDESPIHVDEVDQVRMTSAEESTAVREAAARSESAEIEATEAAVEAKENQ